jgi:hypothetical protein
VLFDVKRTEQDNNVDYWDDIVFENLTEARLCIAHENSGLYYKQVTIVIYDRNDSGHYYKTTITIIIDDPTSSKVTLQIVVTY